MQCISLEAGSGQPRRLSRNHSYLRGYCTTHWHYATSISANIVIFPVENLRYYIAYRSLVPGLSLVSFCQCITGPFSSLYLPSSLLALCFPLLCLPETPINWQAGSCVELFEPCSPTGPPCCPNGIIQNSYVYVCVLVVFILMLVYHCQLSVSFLTAWMESVPPRQFVYKTRHLKLCMFDLYPQNTNR